MGITGLLPLLSSVSSPTNISHFNGCTAAIDVYSWLHKGIVCCAEQLFNGEETDQYIQYVINRTEIVINAGVKPILVFDGQNLPAKKMTEQQRQSNRNQIRERVELSLVYGEKEKARKLMSSCIDVTQEMAKKLIDACRNKGFDYIVAPYEADSQITYLVNQGFAHFSITEDSDMLVFGCRMCLFKMDYYGNGVLIDCNQVPKALSNNFDFEKFRRMCILSGCDYLPSLQGIGINRAKNFFNLTQDTNIKTLLYGVPKHLKMNKQKVKVTIDYVENFIKSENAFKHQLVFCPKNKKLVPLNPYDDDDLKKEDLCDCGEYFDNELAYLMAIGNVDLKTREIIDSYEMQNYKDKDNHYISIWNERYEKPKTFEEIIASRERNQLDHSDNLNDSFETEEINVCKRKDHASIEGVCKKHKVNGHLVTEEYLMNTSCSSKTSINEFKEKGISKPRNAFRNIFKVDLERNIQVQSRFFTDLSSTKDVTETCVGDSSSEELTGNSLSQKSLNSSGNSLSISDEDQIEENSNDEIEICDEIIAQKFTKLNSNQPKTKNRNSFDIRNYMIRK